jgi:hypothetical protein
MRRLLQPFRLRAFRRLWTAYAINGVGDWLAEIALSVIVLDQTGNPLLVAAVFVAGRLIPGLAAPFATSHLERRGHRALPELFAAEAAIFGLLATLSDGIWVGAALALLLIDGVLATTARARVRAELAMVTSSAGLLREGNILVNFAFTAHCAAGPALAGVLVALLGAEVALGINAVTFAIAAALLAWKRGAPLVQSDGAGRAPWLGLAHLGADLRARRLLIGEAMSNVFLALIIPVELVFVTVTLSGSTADLGLVLTLWGVGMLAGGLILPALGNVPLPALTVGSLIVMALAYLGMGVATAVPVVAVWSLVGGLGNGVQDFAFVTVLQERTPTHLQARVAAAIESIHALAPGVGFLAGGLLAAYVSPRATYLIAGGGALLVGITLAALLRVSDPPPRRESSATSRDRHRLASP